ncbi:receptor-type tyrosine-protein phosphatase mu-like, partial [Pecten maximus]|uniref:receptor-type tyrosine-protein phosphatase mu-like n=1 Tax=Pecten maximus TaxID=6579 RepID=UPI0014591303
MFGSSCSLACGQCVGQRCNIDTGHCKTPCQMGWTGQRCDIKVEKQLVDESSTGGTHFGAGVGVGGGLVALVLILIIIVVCIIKRRSDTPAGTASTPSVVYAEPRPSINSDGHSDETGEHVYHELQDGLMPDHVYHDLQNENKPEHVYINLHNENRPEQVYLDLQNGSRPEHVYLELQHESTSRRVHGDLQNDSKSDSENVYYNDRPVGFPVSMLKTLNAEKMEEKEKKFISEFKMFPLGSIHPHTIAERNKPKNRFEAIFPYDHSRVILNTVHEGNSSDYINANFIDSVEERNVYVATQGPLRYTIDDFWRMVWTLNSGKIVMLTNLVESQKTKCEKYWPDKMDQMSTKTFNITLNRERDYGSHIVRNVTLMDRKSKEKREIHQFHFTTWPDHGTPNTLELVLFHRRVMLHRTTLPGQMVVHCSAGIGNTGMFIALDALLDYGKKNGRIDIRHFVNKMMKNRLNMIQTEEQYVALHDILAEAFDLQDTLIPKSMFSNKYHGLKMTAQHQNRAHLRDEFKLMLDLKPDYKLEQDFVASTLPENQTKNRTMRILAADGFRAPLKTYPSNGNDYINAVIAQSYTGRQGYIVTHFPLPDTRTDLWTLVLDYQCDTIIILGDEKSADLDAPWIPEDRADIDIGDFNVIQEETATEISSVDVIDVSIKRKNEKTACSSRVFRLKEWTMEKQVPPSKQSILYLLEQVENRRRASGNAHVLITCKDG